MNLWIIVILLGLIQGLTEFLPVSSSGHLVLFFNIFKINNNTILLSVILHVATLLSVLCVYYKSLFKLIKKPLCKTNICLIITTLITVFIVLFTKPLIDKSFSGNFLVFGFLITAFLLVFCEIWVTFSSKKKNISTNSKISTDITNLQITYFQAGIIGLFQGFACFPAISRSGSTIAGGLICGVNKQDVADYSFIASIPIILASLTLEIYEYIKNPTEMDFNFLQISLGFFVSFIIGLICIKLMLKIVKKQKLYFFSIYLLLLSIILIILKFTT